MAHVRTQIRERFKTALEAALPSLQYEVFASRRYARNDTGKATVDMAISNDQTQAREVMGAARVHVASLYIRVQRGAQETLLDDLLDADEVAIVGAIAAHDWSDILEESPELSQVNFTESDETGIAFGGIILRYDFGYRINKDDPETIIP